MKFKYIFVLCILSMLTFDLHGQSKVTDKKAINSINQKKSITWTKDYKTKDSLNRSKHFINLPVDSKINLNTKVYYSKSTEKASRISTNKRMRLSVKSKYVKSKVRFEKIDQ